MLTLYFMKVVSSEVVLKNCNLLKLKKNMSLKNLESKSKIIMMNLYELTNLKCHMTCKSNVYFLY